MSQKNDDNEKDAFKQSFQQSAPQTFSAADENIFNKGPAIKGDDAYSAIPSRPDATLSAINDTPSREDSIGFRPFVEALSRLITHPDTRTPLSIGLYGPWGSGKSSFMGQVQNMIRGENKGVLQIEFNAWQHDSRDNLWLVFMQSIFTQLEPENVFEKYRLRFASLLKTSSHLNLFFNLFLFVFILSYFVLFYQGNLSALVSADKPDMEPLLELILQNTPGWLSGFLALALLSPSTIATVRKLFTPLGFNLSQLVSGRDFKDSVSSIEKFRGCFESLVEMYLQDRQRLIIYIDDLDRCAPENAVAIIETINILLNVNKTIFIMGIDRDKMTLSVESRYKDLLELNYNQQQWDPANKNLMGSKARYGEQFMEKVIQLPIAVPHPGGQDIKAFAEHLVEVERGRDESGEDARYRTDEKEPPAEQTIELNDIVKESLVKLIPLLERNPRSIKRFYNTYRFVHFLYVLNSEEFAGLNELALPYWYFIYHQYGEKIAVFYRDRVWNQPDEQERSLRQFFRDIKGEIAELDAFLAEVDAENSDWAVIYNSGRPVSAYYRLTRAIFY